MRTIATIAQYLSKRMFLSTKSLMIKKAMETFEAAIVENHPDLEIQSMEDAEEILMHYFPGANLNPGGRGKRVLMHQLEKEDAFLEGRPLPHRKVITKDMVGADQQATKAFMESLTPEDTMKVFDELVRAGKIKGPVGSKYQPRMPDNVETHDEAVARRKGEDEELKDALATVPEDIIVKED